MKNQKQKRTSFTFEEAKDEYERRIIYQSGKYEGIPLQNNTRLVKRGEETYVVKLHRTDVVTYHPDKITLRMGGWDTRTTRDRINTYTPGDFRVYRRRGVTYVSGPGETTYDGNNSKVFDDGMTLTYTGEIIEGAADSEKAKAKRKLDRDVREYIRTFEDAIIDGEIGKPSAGDCWICRMGEGEEADVVHLLRHIDEEYFVPTLLMKAAKYRKQKSQYSSEDPEEYASRVVSYVTADCERKRDLYSHQAKYALQKYFRRHKPDMLEYYRMEQDLEIA